MKKRKATAILMAAVMATGVFSVIGTPVTAKADEDPVTVKWLMFGDKPEDYDMVMEDLNQKIKEKINVELDLADIQERTRDWTVSMPTQGFLYPAFTDRHSDPDHVWYYSSSYSLSNCCC